MAKFNFSVNRDESGKPVETKFRITTEDGIHGEVVIGPNSLNVEWEGDDRLAREAFDFLKQNFPNWFPGIT